MGDSGLRSFARRLADIAVVLQNPFIEMACESGRLTLFPNIKDDWNGTGMRVPPDLPVTPSTQGTIERQKRILRCLLEGYFLLANIPVVTSVRTGKATDLPTRV